MPDLRYPVGPLETIEHARAEQLAHWIDQVAETPASLRAAVERLDAAQLATPYRPGGWTVHQLVHHVADSHMNAYVRFKLALTEDTPTIKPYDQERWATLGDVGRVPIAVSLDLLDALHERWVALLRSMQASDFARTFAHPELGTVTLATSLGIYAWHGRHHVAHITALREREGWT